MKSFVCSALFALLFLIPQPAAAQTLQAVKQRGILICGVSQGIAGFSSLNEKGEWTGLDVDYCKALAAAIFNDPMKTKFVSLAPKDRLSALQSGDVDILTRNTTWTMSRDVMLGVRFAAVNYYDGQGFMVRKSMKINSALELNGASICTETGTTTELNAADFFRSHNLKYEITVFVSNTDVIKAYDAGRCDSYTTDSSQLHAARLRLTNPDDHIILPEIISKEPLAPVVRGGDEQWLNIVRWTHFALLTAEELGVTQENVDEKIKSDQRPDVKRLLGMEGNYGEALGLTNDWAVRIIKAVGNYGEVFDRNFGEKSRLGISRGLNALWSQGGLQYAPPIR